MNQRFIKPGMRAGITARGTVVWALGGAESDDVDDPKYTGADDDSDDDGDDDSDDDESDDDEDEDEKPKGKKKPPVKDKNKKKDDDADDDDAPMYTADEYNKLRRRMRGADARSSALEKENKALKASGRKVEEIETEAVKSATSRAELAEAGNKDMRIKLAFYQANNISWVDPNDALKLIDLREIDVDEDGTVDRKQLSRALRVLAKQKPHLVKTAKKSVQSDDDDEDEDDQAQSGAGTAPKMNGKRKGEKPKVDKASLAKKYPALNKLG